MAASSKQQVLLLAVVAAVACLASLGSAATQWVVGDECGWKKNFNETGWVAGKTFVVGDSLLFRYCKDKHTVVQVASEADFATCNRNGYQLGSWCSGNDVVTLDRPGRMWFICSKGNHCRKGMKLAIDVVPAPLQGAAPPPPPVFWPFPPPPPAWPFLPGAPPPPPSLGLPGFFAPPPPHSGAVRNPVGGAVAAAAAAAVVVAAALVF